MVWVKKMLPAISVNNGCCSLQATTTSPEGTQDGDKQWRQTGCRLPSPQPLQSRQLCTLRGLRMEKSRTQAPENWGACQRNDFSEPRLLHLHIHRKVLKSLTWAIWFSLMNSNLLMSDCLVFVAKTPKYPGSSLPSLEQSLRAIWEAASRGLKFSVLSIK